MAGTATQAPHTWAAMGTTCRTLLLGPDADVRTAAAVARVAALEARWSRFLPDSDVTRLNGADGEPTRLHPETIDLLIDATLWWEVTDGLFDPTILAALEAAGYDRDRRTGHGPIRAGSPAAGLADIRIDAAGLLVQLPPGVRIDLGGIGKGRAVDLVADEHSDCTGGLVELGGDLRVWGRPPQGDPGWAIAVRDLRDGGQLALLGLLDGAVATSSTLARRWQDGDATAHHLIDPRTGRPADGDIVSVTVVAGRAAAAEVLAKSALVAGSIDGATGLLERHGVAALVVPLAGPPAAVGGFTELCWERPEELR